jgi:hypothetical protein
MFILYMLIDDKIFNIYMRKNVFIQIVIKISIVHFFYFLFVLLDYLVVLYTGLYLHRVHMFWPLIVWFNFVILVIVIFLEVIF